MINPAQRQHSPDGLYWWTGNQWVAAWSHDRSHWFDGTRWLPRAHQPPVPLLRRSDWILGGLWCSVAAVATGFAMLAAAESVDASTEPNSTLWTLAALAAVLVVLMPVAGYATGRAPRRLPRMCLAAGAMWGSIMLGYVLSMLTATGPANDDAAGAGVVILAIPTACVVAVLMGLGALARLAVERLARRRSARS